MTDNSIVISGIAGRFPESDNVDEFWTNLINGVDMVTEDDRRWKPGLWGLPKRNGKLKNADKFDATFFGVHGRQADNMDPQLRILMETTFEAIIDAGIDPTSIRGTNTGVWVGVSGGESKESYTKDPETLEGYSMTGCASAMFANRLSYFFDFNGPSLAIDTACSSSLLAFQMACDAINSGKCDAAIVAGANLVLKPHTSLQFQRLTMLSQDGKCKSFDEDGSGYVRSETIASVYICRKSAAKRSYLTVLAADTNTDGYKTEGVTFPSGALQKQLLQRTYLKADINPHDVVYVEAHGTGTKVGDPQEVNTIAEVFGTKRDSPLLIGSVKSNMGHSEPASGLAGLIKCALIATSKTIPPNLHFNTPNSSIPGLNDGRLKVITEPTSLPVGLIAINSFGFGGANVHVVLAPVQHHISEHIVTIPQLICLSDRTEEGIKRNIETLQTAKLTSSGIDILNEISNIRSLDHVGYLIHGNNENADVITSESSNRDEEEREIWYICSGMGTQWKGMGKDLMQLEMFASSIRQCSKALSHTCVDLERLLIHADDATFSNTTNSFVAMASIQVGLIDILQSLGIEADGLIGHSVGELACGYADGSLTLEQTVQAAYCRGKCIEDAQLKGGAMAAVGLSWEECHELCPEGVSPACHNSADSVTISGEEEAVKHFVASLKERGIFAKEVKTSGVAFHSKAMQKVYTSFVRQLKEIIPNPVRRSKRWLSTSVPERNWDDDENALCSAKYHANNLLSPVLFQEALQHVPDNAIVVEIAPHGLLQAILRRSLSSTCKLIPLTKRHTTSELSYLLSAVGKLFLSGCNLNLMKLQNRPSALPVVNCPTSLSSLINWDHSQSWQLPTSEDFMFGSRKSEQNISASYKIDISDGSKYQYMIGHCIDGRVLLPATGYLYFVWKTLADLHNIAVEIFPVKFKDVSFHRATVLHETDKADLHVQIITSSSEFRVSDRSDLIVSGKIVILKDEENVSHPMETFLCENGRKLLKKSEVYKILRLRGYDYAGEFKAIAAMDQEGQQCILEWRDNWVPFLDAMLQVKVMEDNDNGLKLPTRIQEIKIFPQKLIDFVNKHEVRDIPVYFNRYLQIITACNAVEISGLHATSAPRRPLENHPVLEESLFVHLHVKESSSSNDINLLLDIVVENLTRPRNIKVIDTLTTGVGDILCNHLSNFPLLEMEYFGTEELKIDLIETKPLPAEAMNSDFIIVDSSAIERNMLSGILKASTAVHGNDGFVMIKCNVENVAQVSGLLDDANMCMVGSIEGETESWLLCRIKYEKPLSYLTMVVDDGQAFHWVDELKSHLSSPSDQIIWLICNNHDSGILGFVRCLRLEPSGHRIRCLFNKSQSGSLQEVPDDVFARNLFINVHQHDVWGTYRHKQLTINEKKLSSKAFIKSTTVGDLSSLQWFDQPRERNKRKQEYRVSFAALNFRDVMLATGKLSEDAIPGNKHHLNTLLGMEFSGWNEEGERVMGLLPAEGLATHVYANTEFVWKIPETWSMKDACSVPVVYTTAYYSLIIRGKLRQGETVLIHSGSGGVGQAAIAISLSLNCQVFTTVSTKEKRDYLKSRFPKLTNTCFANSRDLSFESHIRTVTKGKGVDVVLNSLSGELLHASIRCLAQHGRFLEIGKYDLSKNSNLGMAIFLNNISFHGILLDSLFSEGNDDWQNVHELLEEGVRNGVVKPLNVTAFGRNEVEAAFRFMSQGKHIGKVALEITNHDSDINLLTHPKISFSQDKSYLVTGGLGGFGLELINWMVDNGARKIIVTSRSGVKTAYQQRYLKLWSEKNAKIIVSRLNIAHMSETEELIALCGKEATLGGIFHLAMILKDAMFLNQTPESFQDVFVAKVNGIKNLDKASRILFKSLDYFVSFSSIVSGRGNAGQTNYGFANASMEQICELRKQEGFPALAVQWGAVGDVGVLIDKFGNKSVGGAIPQPMKSCLEVLGHFLLNSHASVVSSFIPEKIINTKSVAGANKKSIVEVVANIMGIKDPSSVNETLTLGNLGLDSLMSVEIQQIIEREFEVQLNTNEVRDLTFKKLSSMSNKSTAEKQGPELQGNIETIKSRANEFGICDFNGRTQFKETLSLLKSDASKSDKWFLVHPIEGSSSVLQDLANTLDGTCYGFTCVSTNQISMEKLAEHYISEMKRIQPVGPYKLVGYSFGACVAFEMALQLRSQIPTLYLLDGSHSYVTSRIDSYAGAVGNDSKEEAAAFSAFLVQIDPSLSLYALQMALVSMKSREDRLDCVYEEIKKVVPEVDRTNMKYAANRYLYLLRLAYNYKPSTKYIGSAVLIKSSDEFMQSDKFVKDYNLSSVCDNKVKVHQLASNHRNLIFNENAKSLAEIMKHAFV